MLAGTDYDVPTSHYCGERHTLVLLSTLLNTSISPVTTSPFYLNHHHHINSPLLTSHSINTLYYIPPLTTIPSQHYTHHINSLLLTFNQHPLLHPTFHHHTFLTLYSSHQLTTTHIQSTTYTSSSIFQHTFNTNTPITPYRNQ